MIVASLRAARWGNLVPFLTAGLVFAVAAWASQPYAVGVFHDDGVYVILAKALATGDGYRYVHLPGAPIATHYPPGYPLLLAALWNIGPEFPQNLAVFQLANAVFLACTAFSAVLLARRVLGWAQPVTIAVALVATLSYPLIGLSVHVLAEPLFAAVLLPVLLLAERAASDAAQPRDALAAGAATAALCLVKAHGVALVAALVLVLIARRRVRPAIFAAAAAITVLAPWVLWTLLHDRAIAEPLRGSYGSYVPWLVDGLRHGMAFVGPTIAKNTREIVALLADRFSLSDHALPRLVTALVAAAFVVSGGGLMRRRAPVTVAFTAVYVAMLLVWPWDPWRFFYAIWPIVLLMVAAAMYALIAARRSRPTMTMALGTFGVLLIAGAIRAETRAYRERSWQGGAQRATRIIAPAIRWVAGNTRSSDVVAVDAEPIVYLFTGRHTVPVVRFTAIQYVQPRTIATTRTLVQRVLDQLPVTHLVTISHETYRAALLLSDSAAGRGPRRSRLVPIQRLAGGGGAFRVDRHDLSLAQQ